MSVVGTFEKRCLTAGAPAELSFITTSISIVFTVTNIPGNILIILAVVFDPNKNLRTPFNWLIVNLATADLIVGTITDPISVYVHIKEGLGENVTLEEIKTIHMTYFISCTASVLSLASLAVERYLAVRKPNTYRSSVTNKRIILTVAGIWLISLSLPYIYFEVGYTTYAFIFANTSITVAIAITCLTYTLMLRKFKERSQNKTDNNNGNIKAVPYMTPSSTSENEESQGQSSSSTSYPSHTDTSNSVIASARKMEAKVTKMFIIVLIAMLCCYGPSTIFIYIMNFCESCCCKTLHWFRDLQFIFVIMNSSVNFFCYALQSPRFRSAFTKILRIKKRENQADQANFSNISNIQSISYSNSSDQKERVQLESNRIEKEMKNEGTTNEGLDIDS